MDGGWLDSWMAKSGLGCSLPVSNHESGHFLKKKNSNVVVVTAAMTTKIVVTLTNTCFK